MSVDFDRDVYCLLGLPFDAVDMAGTVRRVRQAVQERRRCFLCTPNLNFLVACLTDARFRGSVMNSDLSVADGMPLVWISRLLGIPIHERVAGSSLFEALRSDVAQPLSVYFFGGADGVAEAACRRVNAERSGLKCVGFESPGFGSVEELSDDAVLARINSSAADFLIVSLPARKGQAWIDCNRARITVPAISCLGATLNFAAGSVDRAPMWMQKTGFEWLWRIKAEPLLWRRYFRDGLAFLGLLATRVLPHAWYVRFHCPDAGQLAAAHAETRKEEHNHVVHLKGPWAQGNRTLLRSHFSVAAAAGTDVTLELSKVTYVDSAILGLAMLLKAHQERHGRRLLIALPSEPVCRVVRYCCAEYLLSDFQNSPA